MRVAKQNQPSHADYESGLDEAQAVALNSIVLLKQKMAKIYIERVKLKTFA